MPPASQNEPAAAAAAPPRLSMLLLRLLLFLTLLATVLFAAAGRRDLLQFWAYVGVFAVGLLATTVVVLTSDPTLIRERLKPGPGGRDPRLRAFAVLLMGAHWVIAGLDAGRWRASGDVPSGVMASGLVLMAASFALTGWAMHANRFFSSDARIQRDRNHVVVTHGPYRFLRHPGYLGTVVMVAASPLALGSYWSAAASLAIVPLILRRLRLEERLLLAELEGYADYAARVRFRLLPGIW